MINQSVTHENKPVGSLIENRFILEAQRAISAGDPIALSVAEENGEPFRKVRLANWYIRAVAMRLQKNAFDESNI